MLLAISIFFGLELVSSSSCRRFPTKSLQIFCNCMRNPLLGETYISETLPFFAFFGWELKLTLENGRIYWWYKQLRWWRFDWCLRCSEPKHWYVFAIPRWKLCLLESIGKYWRIICPKRVGRDIWGCPKLCEIICFPESRSLSHRCGTLSCLVFTFQSGQRLGGFNVGDVDCSEVFIGGEDKIDVFRHYCRFQSIKYEQIHNTSIDGVYGNFFERKYWGK